MQAAGVRTVVDQRKLAVVGLIEVVPHIPRIFGILNTLTREAERQRPDLAILTDSAGFHLRLAKRLKKLGIPVIQLIAPQAWAWREWRVNTMRETLAHLLCILPFDDEAEAKPFGNTYSTPGWQRAQQHWSEGKATRSTPHFIEGEMVARDTDAVKYAKGERVFHEKFGYGVISAVEGNKLTIDFDKAGEKIGRAHV